MNNLFFALEAADAGLYVYPGGSDKRPHPMLSGSAPKGQGGFNLATRNPDLIRQWWTRDPGAVVMYNPSKSGLFIADDDTVKKGTSRPELPCTPYVVTTRNGGKHNVYREAEGGLVPRGISDAVDIVHHGGVVLPTPGSCYVWEEQPGSLAALLSAPRWPVDHPWPKGWRGQGRGKGRRVPTGESEQLRDPPMTAIPYAELWARFAGQKRGWRHDEITDRSKAAWSLLQECRGAGCDDELAFDILAGYPPLRERCEERSDPDGALEDWIIGQLELLDQEGCAHTGRNCVDSNCDRASDWLMSAVLTGGMLGARAMVEANPGISEVEVLRRVFGSKRPAWLFDWVRTNAERRHYWTTSKARKGTRGPQRATLWPVRRKARLEHPRSLRSVESSGSHHNGESPTRLPRSVDVETGEVLDKTSAQSFPGTRANGPAQSFSTPEPSKRSSRERARRTVFYREPPDPPETLGCEPKLCAEGSSQKESKSDMSPTSRSDVDYCSFETAICVSCGEPCHADFNPHPNCPLPTQEVAAA